MHRISEVSFLITLTAAYIGSHPSTPQTQLHSFLTIPIVETATQTITITTGTPTITPTVVIVTSCGIPAALEARGEALAPPPKPSCLNGYSAGAPLSSACKYRPIKPYAASVKTITVTEGQPEGLHPHHSRFWLVPGPAANLHRSGANASGRADGVMARMTEQQAPERSTLGRGQSPSRCYCTE